MIVVWLSLFAAAVGIASAGVTAWVLSRNIEIACVHNDESDDGGGEELDPPEYLPEDDDCAGADMRVVN